MDRTQRIADAYCARVAALMRAGQTGDLVRRAHRNLDLMAAEGTMGESLLVPWRRALADPQRLPELLTAEDPEAARLRRNHPFAGALPERERQDIVRAAADAA